MLQNTKSKSHHTVLNKTPRFKHFLIDRVCLKMIVTRLSRDCDAIGKKTLTDICFSTLIISWYSLLNVL